MTSKEEKWEIIEDYPNYLISTLGRIKSTKTNKILKPYITKRGYVYNLLSKNGKVKNFQVHRLVAKAFIDNPLNKPCVNHIDFNPSNNNVDNLEWVTHSENCLWSSKNISLSHKGKDKTDQHKKAIRKSMLSSKNSKQYIYKNGNGYMFRFRPSKNEDINKTYKTLQEAINCRDEYFKREKNMLSSKEALKCIIVGTNVDTYRSSIEEIDEAIETIEKDLEVLEIIKKHKLLNYVLKNEKCANMYHLSKEEIDLLREIEK